MYLNTTACSDLDEVNPEELEEVRQHYLPPVLVRLVPLQEIARRADEISREEPRLREEVRHVWREEVDRRHQLAACPLTLA